MNDEMREKITKEMTHYENAIRKIDVEIAKLQGKREAFEDAKTMLFELLNK